MSKEALLFPGQGLPTKDIIEFYTKLNSLDPNSIGKRISQAQEALDKVHGASENGIYKDQFKSILQDI